MPKFPFGLKRDTKSDTSVPDFFDQVEQWKNTGEEEALNEPSGPQPVTAQPQQAPAPQAPQPAPQQPVKPAQNPQPVQGYIQPAVSAPTSKPTASQPTNVSQVPTVRPVPQPVQPVQPIQPVPSQYVAPQPVAQPVQQQAAGETAVDQLVELAKVLGMDSLVTNWENMKKFAAQLDEEEKRMQKELEELQNKLNLVRMTRELLRRIGI
ncbi:hypothetical protein [Thermofilum sp.]|jgi:outer membrane biosynthesis protein TonB|uniref:hypothetical protein n=1 Tax=Thermofilum sp. TaxID=1961369 RepID=UPI002582CB56|nr:hypothetical protein [Thermofilum sp.]